MNEDRTISDFLFDNFLPYLKIEKIIGDEVIASILKWRIETGELSTKQRLYLANLIESHLMVQRKKKEEKLVQKKRQRKLPIEICRFKKNLRIYLVRLELEKNGFVVERYYNNWRLLDSKGTIIGEYSNLISMLEEIWPDPDLAPKSLTLWEKIKC